jgi:hypothetical protein
MRRHARSFLTSELLMPKLLSASTDVYEGSIELVSSSYASSRCEAVRDATYRVLACQDARSGTCARAHWVGAAEARVPSLSVESVEYRLDALCECLA